MSTSRVFMRPHCLLWVLPNGLFPLSIQDQSSSGKVGVCLTYLVLELCLCPTPMAVKTSSKYFCFQMYFESLKAETDGVTSTDLLTAISCTCVLNALHYTTHCLCICTLQCRTQSDLCLRYKIFSGTVLLLYFKNNK